MFQRLAIIVLEALDVEHQVCKQRCLLFRRHSFDPLGARNLPQQRLGRAARLDADAWQIRNVLDPSLRSLSAGSTFWRIVSCGSSCS
jgi:hypothetical protein